MAVSSTKTQLRLKLILLWLAVAFGHLGHTTSHYLDREIFSTEATHEKDHDQEGDASHEHEHEAGPCVICIAFAFVVLELTRTVTKDVIGTHTVFLAAKQHRIESRGIQILGRPGQPRAPPKAA